jgi:hypothetical protein
MNKESFDLVLARASSSTVKEASLSELYAKLKPQVMDAIDQARTTVSPHFDLANIGRYLRSPMGRGAIGGGLLGAAYGFARQKGPNESAVGNALRAGLVGAAGGGLIGRQLMPARPQIDWRQKLAPSGGTMLGEGGVHPSHPMFEQFKRNDMLRDIHQAYDTN